MAVGDDDDNEKSARRPKPNAPNPQRQKTIGRYALHAPISAGGMASVHFGRLLGPIGFTRTVAIKRLHAAYATDPESVTMFLDEARLAARIHHPNVVSTLDVVEAADNNEIFLVMEYVGGLSLSTLLREAEADPTPWMPSEHAVAILIGALHGLHAAHEAKSAAGDSLAIVHRDISPQNILVGADGVARVIDFGIAKASERLHLTRDNSLRGKVHYMAPEQLTRGTVDRRADIYAASVVLWEMLTSRRYVDVTGNPAVVINAVLAREPEPPSEVAGDAVRVTRALDNIVLRGLARDPTKRFATALEMAAALESAVTPSSQREVAVWVSRVGGEILRERADLLRLIENEPEPESDRDPESIDPESIDPESIEEISARPIVTTTSSTPSTVRLEHRHPASGSAITTVASLTPRRPSEAPPRAIPAPMEAPTTNVWVDASKQAPTTTRRIDLRPLAIPAVLGAILLAWIVGARTTARAPNDAVHGGPSSDVGSAVFPPAPIVVGTTSAAPSIVELPDNTPRTTPPTSSASSARRSPPPPPPRATCNPPYKMDHGIRVPKPECL